MNKIKKSLSVFLAVLMIMSFTSLFASAAEQIAPEITEWPTIVGTAEVGTMYKDLVLQGGSASVPGTFSLRSTIADRAITSPSASGVRVLLTFTPEDTETYSSVNCKSAEAPRVVVNPCSNPVLQGEVTAKAVLAGTALGTSELALAADAVILANTTAITNRVDTITFDNPDQVYTELGTYEVPATIKFKTITAGAYAVDLKTTVKVRVSDKLDAEITTAPTFDVAKNYLVKENSTAKELVLTGGVANTEGTFTVTNPDQKLVGGDNTINITFTPADTTKYNPVTVDVIVTLTQAAKVPENTIFELPYSSTQRFSKIKNARFPDSGIEPADASIYVMGLVDQPELYETIAGVGEYKVYVNIYSNTKLIGENVVVTLKIVPGTSTGTFINIGAISEVQNDGSYLVTITHRSLQEAPVLNGTTKVKVNGEVIAEYPVSKESVKTAYVAKKSGHYEISVEYVPAEGDYLAYTINEFTCYTKFDFEITMPRKVEAIGSCDISHISEQTDEGLAIPGATVNVNCIPLESYEKFEGWIFYDDNGNEFIPEGISEDYMTKRNISFTMPNHDVQVKAIVSINLGGDDTTDGGDINDDNSGSSSGNAGSTSIFGSFFEYLRSLFEKFINLIKTVFGMYAPAN